MKLTDIQGISPARYRALQASGIQTADQLILMFPRTYIDRRKVLGIRQLHGTGEKVTVIGKITDIVESGFGRKKRLEAILQDDTGQLKGIWFKGITYFSKTLKKGTTVAFFGTVKRYGRYLSMAHPEVEHITGSNDTESNSFARIVPVYPGNKLFRKTYITSGLLKNWICFLLDQTHFQEFLPEKILHRFQLPERNTAFRWIHAPESPNQHIKAMERFKFEELFLFELSIISLKKEVFDKTPGPILNQTKPLTSSFFNSVIPFELTSGQKNALTDIKRDFRCGRQMNRLLQGDVGSGKTVVAIGAILMAVDSGYQAAMMAPTEILAEQHFHTLNHWLSPLGVTIRLLISNQKKSLRYDIMSDITGGTANIVIGTHAIIQDAIRFHRLGLAIIDEQHRFGVSQRALLREKGEHPHILVMSATPIPRSLAMTLYSDLDLSVIRDLPPGRKEVLTHVMRERDRPKAHSLMNRQLQDGGQIYIVYPLIEESEAMDLKNATEGFDQIRTEFPDYTVGLLHSRIPPNEKETVMHGFMENKINILVTTTVIEVGVNVPNASIMVIEHAERFGLSQLHQLRGRTGRGERQSYCLLMADIRQSKEARSRLATMEETTDGFRIAEADLKLRGPGDFLGTKQSGLPEFRFADILSDQHLLEKAKESALGLLSEDPLLENEAYQELKKKFLPHLEEKKKFFRMS